MHLSDAPPESREFITAAALEVGMILNRYIAVHDDLFRFSIRRIVPIPGIFKKIDFQHHFKSLRFAEMALEDVAQQLPGSSSAAPDLLAALQDYITRLATTIAKLRDICGNMFQKADGTIQYSMQQYQADVDDYNHSVPHYQEAGAALNSAINKTG